MKKFLALAAALLFSSSLALGQAFTAITATGIFVDNGSGVAIHPAAGSTLCFLGVNASGAVITYTPAGGGPVTGAVCQTLNASGTLTGSLTIGNPALASPPGLRYTISVANGPTTYQTIPTVQLSGPAFVFNTFALPVNGKALGIGSPHLACNQGATWTSTTYPTGQDSFTCSLVSGIGQWQQYPQGGNYCPTGMGYLAPQGDPSGKGFCLPPVMAGIGAPSGSCVKNSTYYQQDLPGVAYACIADVWQLVAGGGSAGLTSFQGRSTAGATLQTPDVQGVLNNAPFGLTGSQGLMMDSAAGTTSPSANWILGSGALAGQMIGIKNLNLGTTLGGTPTAIIRAADGSASLANGSFTISAAGLANMAAGSLLNGSLICTAANAACPTSGAAFYQTAQNATVGLTPRNKLNFITATGVNGADDPSNGSTDLSLSAVPNSALANSSITINCSGSCSGGGTVALGGSTTLTVTGGGGGSNVPSPQFQVPYYNTAGTQASIAGDTAATTDGAGNHTLLSLNAFNPLLQINMTGNQNPVTNDYQICNAAGTSCIPWNNPYTYTDNISTRQPGSFGQTNSIGAHQVNFNVYNGGQNNSDFLTNFIANAVVGRFYTPGQIGGFENTDIAQSAAGDSVVHNVLDLWWGCSRGTDECAEGNRENESPLNPNYGGTIAIGATATSGDTVVTITPTSGYNIKSPGTQNPLIDVTKRVQLGNMISSGFSSWDTEHDFVTIQLDAAHSLSATTTRTTAAIDDVVYTGTCPTVTNTGTPYPIVGPNQHTNDAWTTLQNGAGVQGINGNYDTVTGAEKGFCIPVVSTAGMSNGMLIALSHGSYDYEQTRILSVVDSTHITAFVHHNHDANTLVSFGNGIGMVYGLNKDERPVGYSTQTENSQTAILRLGYPIVAIDDSTHITVWVDPEATVNTAELKTLGYRTNIPRQVIDIEPTVVGGVVTSITFDQVAINNYFTDSSKAVPGGKSILGQPQLAFGGSSACTTNPVFTWKVTNLENRLHYVPSLVGGSGGTGCPSNLTITAVNSPNPAWVAPFTEIEKSTDPTLSYPSPTNQIPFPSNPLDGVILTQAVPSGIANGDEMSMGMWPDRYQTEFKSHIGDEIVANSGRFGATQFEFFAFTQNGQAYHVYSNQVATSHYYSTFAHNWIPQDASEGTMTNGSTLGFSGAQNGFAWDLPPVSGLTTAAFTGGTPGAPSTGGFLLTVNCSVIGTLMYDHPCNHGLFAPYGVLHNLVGVESKLYIDPSVGTLRYDHTFLAAKLEASPTVQLDSALDSNIGLLTQVSTKTIFSSANVVDDLGQVFAGRFQSPILYAGATGPLAYVLVVVGTPGSTTYSYASVAATSQGTSIVSATGHGSTATGNASLGSSCGTGCVNSIVIEQDQSVGAQFIDTYRTSTTGGLAKGRICHVLVNQNCNDIGQAPDIAGDPPAVDTSGLGHISGPLELAGILKLLNPSNVADTTLARSGAASINIGVNGNATGNVNVATINTHTPLRFVCTITTTAATSDTCPVTGLTSANHVWANPTNSTAQTVIVGGYSVVAGSALITLNHTTATAAATFDVFADIL